MKPTHGPPVRSPFAMAKPMSSDVKRPVWEEWLDVGCDVGLQYMRNSAYVKYSVGDGDNLKRHLLAAFNIRNDKIVFEAPLLLDNLA